MLVGHTQSSAPGCRACRGVTEELGMRDLFTLRDKVAVVTGGSRGIGLMIADGLVSAGARVYISSRKAEACDAAAARLSEQGECISAPADLSRLEGIEMLVDRVAAREPSLNILVNNAGATWGADFSDYPDSGWDKVLAVNLKAVFYVTQHFAPMLRTSATAEDPARVINIGSVDGLRVPSREMRNYAYSASKAAVHMLTRHMAQALIDDHILVNAIAPGLFPTKMMQFVFEDADLNRAIIGTIPIHRAGSPEDIAGPVVFLASRASAYLTGAVIPVDGGVATIGPTMASG
jgi:NAD(P)-dependent dehydrogenase (short-subunit alcohol dehydrogenase family)